MSMLVAKYWLVLLDMIKYGTENLWKFRNGVACWGRLRLALKDA